MLNSCSILVAVLLRYAIQCKQKMNSNDNVTAIILAAGKSDRMKGVNKMLIPFKNNPLILHTVNVFHNSPLIQSIVLVVSKDLYKNAIDIFPNTQWNKITNIVIGGERRQDSVRNGLSKSKNTQWVIIHDGARPFITESTIQQGLIAAKNSGSAVAAVPVTDTIKEVENNNVTKTLPRHQLWSIQTPQIFRYEIIKQAYEQISEDATDDASMVEQLGKSVNVFMGSYNNIKLTTLHDINIAKYFFENDIR